MSQEFDQEQFENKWKQYTDRIPGYKPSNPEDTYKKKSTHAVKGTPYFGVNTEAVHFQSKKKSNSNRVIKITDELENKILEEFEFRANRLGLNGQTRLDAQREFVIAAIATIDAINGSRTLYSCTPSKWQKAMRDGEYLT